jgi:Zn finger protein HypA/HybF involved in hydrogenase expression
MENYEINPIYQKKVDALNTFILSKKSFVSNDDLALFLVDKEILEYKCKKCDNDGMWFKKPLPLVLDRLNNLISDNRIENLRFLCPNCFAQIKKKKTLFKKIIKDTQRLCIECKKRIPNKSLNINKMKCQSLRCKKCLLTFIESQTPEYDYTKTI